MERPNAKGANNFIVGLFVFMGLLVGAGFVVFMGGGTTLGGMVPVRTYFSDVRGLNIGAPVLIAGIQVGRVTEFRFEESSASGGRAGGILTVLSIYQNARSRVRKDSEASVTTMGMLGDKVIVISPGTQESPELGTTEILSSLQSKELSDYFAKGGGMVDSLNDVAAGLAILLKQLNSSGRIPQIIDNLDRISTQLATTTKNLNDPKKPLGSLITGDNDSLGVAAASLKTILKKIEKGEGTLGALVNDSSLHEDMRILLGGAKRSQSVKFLLRQAISSSDKSDTSK